MTGVLERLTWATSWENLFLQYANNKGADQPALPRSLIITFFVRYLDSIIPLVSLSEISSLQLASVAAQGGMSLPWSQTPRMRRMICAFVVRIWQKQLFSWRGFHSALQIVWREKTVYLRVTFPLPTIRHCRKHYSFAFQTTKRVPSCTQSVYR